ncbi:MAG TPA: DUF4276 family protein [Thermoanaerobaculia bacterium]|nr:DUF4276 family protein [Thermoanaerobaculia bacterium]
MEGGGNHNDALKTECRRAFTALLERAGFKGRMPRIVACGGRRNAYEQFCTAIDEGEASAILLVDAEAPVAAGDPWKHVAQRQGDQWDRPDGATEDHLHLMVQCMEAWFLADRRALREFFGQGFQENALPAVTCVPEDVGKPDLYKRLKQATAKTKAKGAYDKGKHSFKLLAMLDPDLVRQAGGWAERFFATLDRLM